MRHGMLEPHPWIPFPGGAGFAWPALPPPEGQTVLAIQFQLDVSQWLEPAAIAAQQFRQLRRLVRFAAKHVPHYRGHLGRSGIGHPDAIDAQSFLRWPVLTKAEIQHESERFLAQGLPQSHGGVHWGTTSGSTGRPLRAADSGIGAYFQQALWLRGHLWYELDPRDKFAIIRSSSARAAKPDWGPPANLAFRTGPAVTLASIEDHAEQLEWLRGEAPAYLLANNTNLRALIELSRRQDLAPTSIRTVIGFADMAPPDIAYLAKTHWNARYFNTYSCNEMGVLALHCPTANQLHVQSENVLLEILRPDGAPCAPGEIGRVIVTDLHNFAMPLIRYELGDQAAPGLPCACGRGLPVLEMVAGRTHDLAVDPTGRSFFVHLGAGFWTAIAPVTQRQIVQLAPDRLEIRYVAERDLTGDEIARLVRGIRAEMRYDYAITCTRVPSIALGPSGKFADFVSMIGR